MEESKNYSCFALKLFLKFNVSVLDYLYYYECMFTTHLKAAVHIEEKRQSEYSADG